MHDKTIFKICSVTTIIGLVGIIFLTGYVNPEQLKIEDIDKSKIDNQVEVHATIQSIHNTKSQTRIITIADDTTSINLVIFPTTINVIELNKGDRIGVVAKVTEYNGQLELILEDSSKIQHI